MDTVQHLFLDNYDKWIGILSLIDASVINHFRSAPARLGAIERLMSSRRACEW